MVDPGIADPEAREPGPVVQSCHVHGPLPIRIFRRTKALYHLQSSKLKCHNS